jgi:HEPN domain-containing protein
MKPITLEWIEKAEGDWTSAQREYRARQARQRPNYDAACFHAQQCAEKYLRARLEEAGITFSRTHNLTSLLTLALAVEPPWTVLQPYLTALNIYSVAFRYPGSSATKSNAANALKAGREVRHIVRQSFDLSV